MGEPRFDPYVAPPAEGRPPGRLSWLGPWLGSAAIILVVLALLALWLLTTRQDPSLDVPAEIFGSEPSGVPTTPLTVPGAPTPAPS